MLTPTEQLIQRALANDSDALTELVQRNFAPVYAVGLSYLRNREQAEDLAQEVFLRGWLGLGKLRRPEYFGTWLVSIARNLASTWRRKAITRSQLLPLVPLGPAECEVADGTGTPHDRLTEKQQGEQLASAIWRLPQEQREVVLLHYAEGYSKSDIARLLGVHPSSVGRQLDKALLALRAQLESELRAATSHLRSREVMMHHTAKVLIAAAALGAGQKAALAGAALGGGGGVVGGPVASGMGSMLGGGLMAKAAAAVAGVLVVATALAWRGEGGSEKGVPTGERSAVLRSLSKGTQLLPGSSKIGTNGGGPFSAAIAAARQTRPRSPVSQPWTNFRIRDDAPTTIGTATVRGVTEHARTRQPVAGAVVELWRRDDLSRYKQPVRKALSEPDGTFVMEDLPDGEFLLYAEKDELRLHPPHHGLADTARLFVLEDQVIKLTEGSSTNTRVLVSEGFTVSGVVLNTATSQPIAGARVRVHDGQISKGENRTSSGADGTFELKHVFGAFAWSNTARLNVTARGYMPPPRDKQGRLGDEADGHDLPVDATRVDGVELWLMPAIEIAGRVVDEKGAPVARAILNLCTSGSLNSRPGCRADADGLFRFDVLPHTEIVLAVRRDQDHPTTLSQPYQVAGEPMRLPDFLLQDPRELSGVVIGPNGQPLSGVSVSANVGLRVGGSSTSSGEHYGSVKSGADGRFTFAKLPQGTFEITATLEGFPAVRTTAQVNSDEGGKLTLSMAEGYSVSGRVVDSEERPVRGADVMSFEEHKFVKSQADGSFVLKGLRAGGDPVRDKVFKTLQNTIGASHPDFGYVQVHNVAPGTAGLQLQIGGENGHASLDVKVVDSATGKPIANAVVKSPMTLNIGPADEAGSFRANTVQFPGGPQGIFWFEISAPGYEPLKTEHFNFESTRALSKVYGLRMK